MYCPKCGKDLNNDAKFCTNCGYQIVKENLTETYDINGHEVYLAVERIK